MSIDEPFIRDSVERAILEKNMKGPMKYTLMNDFLSKYSLQKDLYALKGLVAALQGIDEDSITDIEILNPIEPGDIISDKNCILDIKIEVNNNSIINIEIQSRFQDFWPERSILYLCRNFDHLKEGEGYNNLKKCVQIGILQHDLFKEDDRRYTGEFYSEYRLLNVNNHKEYSSKFSIRVLSLKHVENASEEDKKNPNSLYFWAKLFKAKTWEELMMIAKDNPRMESLVGTVRHLTEEDRIAEMCEARRKYSLDVATYEGEIKTLKGMCEEARTELDETNEKLEEATGKLEETTGKLEEITGKLEETTGKLEETTGKLEETTGKLEETTSQLEEANVKIAERDNIIAELKARLGEK